jgi:predicted nucleic acid-binding protein
LSPYADSSFLVSLYVPDTNSARAATIMRDIPLPVSLTSLGELELANALHLRLFRKEMSATDLRVVYRAFVSDVRTRVFVIKPLVASVYERSFRLASKWTPKLGTRSLDIIHVASALVLGADTFFTFDHRQARLAKAAGLKTL